jgi:acyl carrier protein phosphodiesterase
MNYLAHIYLSGDDPLVRIGNFMADGIRGKDYEEFPEAIQKGILLHRSIDSFTDAHPIFRKGTARLHASYHHYAGVIMDVFYDHFLARNWIAFSESTLEDYVQEFYDSMQANLHLLTVRAREILPVMKQYNWLASYATVEGIAIILNQMDLRTGNRSNMRFADSALRENYNLLEEEFLLFFEDIQVMASERLLELHQHNLKH